MPAAVASRTHEVKNPRHRDSAPPAKKARLAQSLATMRPNGLKALVNGTSTKKPTAKINGAKSTRADRVDEATAVVGGGQPGHGDVAMVDAGKEVIEISSAEEESEDEASDNEQEDGPVQDGTAEPEDISFADRLRAHDPEPVQESRIVDVESAFDGPDGESQALATTTNSRPLAAPNASSLGTVLTQALRTNDSQLFESCLRVIDVDAVYATVERLPSPLVGTLLQKLAERLHKKPGRAGMLMAWVQWSLAAHGGYLATQPHLVKQLTNLNKVLKERSSGLAPLLSLKGRLDMLSAQLDLRKRNQRAANDEDDNAVIYVEGEDEYISGDEESVNGDVTASGQRKRLRQEVEDDDESSVDEMPTTMEMDEISEEGSDSDGLIDDEASETDDDLGEASSEAESDLGDESEEESKPERRSTAARAGLKSRR
ncbi:NUC189-domain-containing protein [Clathrospora elynae]|uniref:NUC189-domain-containing protein n=1 Tax=Clathrospora elynae TaxID=706981 RepID=A0A6A5SFN5_9PLEO|nr:NUC189-domain-containing protein [Clathrospora elynae]